MRLLSWRIAVVAILASASIALALFSWVRAAAAPAIAEEQVPEQVSTEIQSIKIEEVDPRYENLNKFFDRYKCPEPRNVETYILEADKHGIDYRLLPAISVKESTCGKFVPHWCPKGVKSWNYWGYRRGCYANSAVGITQVMDDLANDTPWVRAKKDPWKILWIYNGTVESKYPARVKALMEQIEI